MTVKDVIYYASIMCGKEDLAEKIISGVIPDDNADVVRMLNCYNLTVSELSEHIEPLVFTETLSSDDGEYRYVDFTKPPKQILKVTCGGKNVEYTVCRDKVVTGVTRCEITYDYRAKRVSSLSDEIEYDENVFSPRVLAMGVASEFLLISGAYEECASWRSRYDNAVETYLISKTRKIKQRRWA